MKHCKECTRLRAIVNRFSRVVKDSQEHIANQAAFIEKMKRIIREESAVGLKVSPLSRPARRGNL